MNILPMNVLAMQIICGAHASDIFCITFEELGKNYAEEKERIQTKVLGIHFWKNHHFTKLLWIILISTSIFLLTFTQIELKAPNISVKLDTPKNNITHYFINTPGCKIPSWPIFSKRLEKYFEYNFTGPSCNNGTPPLVQSNITSLFLMEDHFPFYNIDDNSLLHCCYEELKRRIPRNGKDRRYEFGDICITFNQRADISMEFVHVKCNYVNKQIYEDFFAFVPPKHNETFINNTQQKYNVLIMGLDSISRLNFHRQMPKTVKFLKDLGFVEFLGYNKLADNTHPNLITVLTGYDEKTIRRICKTSSNYFDNCKFIWDNFKAENYITSFGEDAARLGIFNFEKKGFKKQPTDYMWGFFNLIAEKLLGNLYSKNVHQCVGGREVYKIFLQYMYDFVSRMESWKLPYFAFFWSASLSHDEVNNPRIGDVVYLQSLGNMSNKGYFDNTIVVLMSDHGIRFGPFRQTYQGGIEDRLPFLFIKVPRQFEESFPSATTNLKWNAKVLTTHFDVYETLLDISSPSRLTDEFIESGGRKSNGRTGLSLFQKIQPTRTCKAAGIPDHWCTCLNSRPISVSPEVTNVVEFVIEYINERLRNYSECETLLHHKIISANLLTHSMKYDREGETNKEFLVNFQTKPGDGLFEATVRSNNGRSLEIVDTISRLNLYGNQSICIDNYHLKKYCYCKKYKSKN